MFSGPFKVALVAEVFGEEGAADSLHDIVLEVTGTSCTEPELHVVFFGLPEDIQCDALKWGIGDTEVRDSIYTHLKKAKDNE